MTGKCANCNKEHESRITCEAADASSDMMSGNRYFMCDQSGIDFLFFSKEEFRDNYADRIINDYISHGMDEHAENMVRGEITHLGSKQLND